ncbi:MAG: DNA modification methylase [Brevundimonas sp.]
MRRRREALPSGRLIWGQRVTNLPDIKPQTQHARLSREKYIGVEGQFRLSDIAAACGMSPVYVARVLGRKAFYSVDDALLLLDDDAFSETLVPRSKVLDWLLSAKGGTRSVSLPELRDGYALVLQDALDFIRSLPSESVNCVVTSTPYWGLRVYKDSKERVWADGDSAVFGHEQTPEAFVRHTTEVLHELLRVLTPTGSIWWNVMDTFNTRTQIRGNAVEALRAMQGQDKRTWAEHGCRRYSAGHSYLKDGEQCLIPSRIAERAGRIGLYVKSVITWDKTSTLPEPQDSRVSRNLEYVLHLTKVRAPQFDKSAYRELSPALGGRNSEWETDKLSDVWTLPTSSGGEGHGAQFPLSLPGRCIALSTGPGDVILDPFVGSGTTGLAALALGRTFIGSDVSSEYLATAERRLSVAASSKVAAE